MNERLPWAVFDLTDWERAFHWAYAKTRRTGARYTVKHYEGFMGTVWEVRPIL